MTANTYPTRTFTITLGNRTEDVTFEGWQNTTGLLNRYVAVGVFAARIGNGAKLYAANMMIHRFANVDEAKARGYFGRWIVTDDDGTAWGIQLNTAIRNRQATIVAFADDYAGTDAAAKHNDYSTIR